MQKSITIAAVMSVAFLAGSAAAGDISTKKMQVKDHATDTSKRQIQLQSKDVSILYPEDADAPGTKGASIHVYNASNDLCVVIGADAELWKDNGKGWKYKNPDTKNQVQLSDSKLIVKLRSGVDFDLTGTAQGSINATVQLGDAGERFCMKCTPFRDDELKWQAKDCLATPCDAEPGSCLPSPTTTTSSTTTTTTTTTTTMPGTVVGAIAANGRFNLNMAVGIPAAEAACESNFPGSHLCKYAELVASQGAPMTGLQDIAMNPVTSFWAVDPALSVTRQCGDTLSESSTRWVYNTGHLGIGGDAVTLDNGTGMLGALVQGGGANRNCNNVKWIGCCQ